MYMNMLMQKNTTSYSLEYIYLQKADHLYSQYF